MSSIYIGKSLLIRYVLGLVSDHLGPDTSEASGGAEALVLPGIPKFPGNVTTKL